jgi:hypothetical protein
VVVIFGIFIILHGLVHLFYMGQSLKLFELKPAMIWPDESWAFSRILSNATLRLFASITLALSTLGFVVGGISLMLKQAWSQPILIVAGGLSTFIYLVMWNGKRDSAVNQGGLGMLINLAILSAVRIYARFFFV